MCQALPGPPRLESQTILEEKQPKPKVFAEDSVQCDKCGSIRVIRFGITCHKQTYFCKDCSHKFTPSLIKKSKFTPELVSLTLDLYFSGTSLRKVSRIVSDHTGQYLGATTIYDWIQKFVPQISAFVDSLNPELSDTWHVDEIFQPMKGSGEYKNRGKVAFLWNVMDRKTRFLLASKLSRFRDAYGGFEAIKEAKRNARGSFPDYILTDGLHQYKQVMRRELPDTVHTHNSGIRKPHATNNHIERLNGTPRERMKVTRGWKSMESQIAEGQRIHLQLCQASCLTSETNTSSKSGNPNSELLERITEIGDVSK